MCVQVTSFRLFLLRYEDYKHWELKEMARSNIDFVIAEEMVLEEFEDLNTETKFFS